MFTTFLVQLQKLGKRTSWVPRVGLPGAEAALASTLGSITGTSSAQQDTGPYPDPPCLLQSDPLCQPQVQSPGFSAAPLPFPRLDLEPQHLLPCLHLPVFAGTGRGEVRERRALKSRPSTICIGKTCVLKARASRGESRMHLWFSSPGLQRAQGCVCARRRARGFICFTCKDLDTANMEFKPMPEHDGRKSTGPRALQQRQQEPTEPGPQGRAGPGEGGGEEASAGTWTETALTRRLGLRSGTGGCL